jgi:hypothetical protein
MLKCASKLYHTVPGTDPVPGTVQSDFLQTHNILKYCSTSTRYISTLHTYTQYFIRELFNLVLLYYYYCGTCYNVPVHVMYQYQLHQYQARYQVPVARTVLESESSVLRLSLPGPVQQYL